MRMVAFLLIASLVLPLSSAVADVEEIIKAHFDAVGGRDALNAVTSVTRSGKLVLGGAAGGLDGVIEEAVIVGKKTYSKSDYGIGSETTAWNGKIGWKDSQEGLIELEGEDLDFVKLAMYLDPIQWVYEEYGAVAFVPEEDREFHGRDCITLGILDEPTKFLIDKETHHVVGFESVSKDPAFGEISISIRYGDFTEYGDIMLPNSSVFSIADGMMTVDTSYTDTKLDVEIDEALFDKP